VGVPVQCAEFVPHQLARHVPWSTDFVAQEIRVMRTHLPSGEVVQTPSAGYMLERALFDRALATAACQCGVDLLLGTRAVAPSERGLVAQSEKERFEIETLIIIGADGPRSTVGRWIGQVNRELIHASQCQVVLEREVEGVEIYFDPFYAGGYGWLFPKGPTANVGVGWRFGHRPSEALQHLLDRLRIRRTAILGHTDGFIPSGGPLEKTWEGNFILVGDAAGQTHPITGAGIAHACLCGEMAGRVAAEAARNGELGYLAEYESEWRSFLGGVLAHALRKRHFLEEHWSEDGEALSKVLRQSWVAFPAYGHRGGAAAAGEGSWLS
ncbi:MAG: NAD(P)/FAD-dependent oxidoreductase, partial [Chloroflexota bacterium]|nr:NAD(P)/FAD-dependent oxidoreductase [Chloroflexota bacterium]